MQQEDRNKQLGVREEEMEEEEAVQVSIDLLRCCPSSPFRPLWVAQLARSFCRLQLLTRGTWAWWPSC